MIRKLLINISIILCVTAIYSCNNTDDIQAIFTEKTWKLTSISHKNGERSKDYWMNSQGEFDEEAFKKSMELSVTIDFSGKSEQDIIQGDFHSDAAGVPIDGNWKADASSRTFNTWSIKGGSPTDIYTKAFLDALKNSFRYQGDEYNLYIYFKEGQQEKMLMLKPLNREK